MHSLTLVKTLTTAVTALERRVARDNKKLLIRK